uniref:Uncharacterized protein n=1 Tax=Streptomyces sp. NBC_00049 TaxID=2903617 RepID=A0AAU2JGX9_9ACTN
MAANGPGMVRVLKRTGHFVSLYCGLHTAAWVAAYPLAGNGPGASFWTFMGHSLMVLATLGTVTMLVGLSAGLAHVQMEVETFRRRLDWRWRG